MAGFSPRGNVWGRARTFSAACLAAEVRLRHASPLAAAALFATLLIAHAPAQSPAPQPAPQPAAPPNKVLFSRDLNSPDSPPATPPQPTPDDTLAVTDAERTALTITAYDLDLHLTPASAAIGVHARLTLRNDSPAPLTRLILQISSSLHWDAFSGPGPTSSGPTSSGPAAPTALKPLAFVSHPVETDADHTGKSSEAVVTLPQPLAPGASLTLSALYSGAIAPSAERLERIGAPSAQALDEDWDAIAADGTALRGFGNVLWYPVAAAPVFLGDGNKLFRAVGDTRLRESTATVRLRLAVEYADGPPDAAFFCGRRQHLTAISDDRDAPIADSSGVATALFDTQPLGFRSPSLFIAVGAPSQTGTAANPALISAVTATYDALPAYAAAATLVEPLLTDWFGPRPLTALNILDHPGQPFEDDALLVRPIRAVDPAALAPSLAHSLTHAWIRSSRPWIDEGLAQFASLLWIERSKGRAAALADLEDAYRTLAFAEAEVSAPAPADATPIPPPSPNGTVSQSSSSSNPGHAASPTAADNPGRSLIAATSDVFYRTKAAAVFWMLRGIVGDDALKQALQAYKKDPNLDRDPSAFELTLEDSSHTDLRWFFDDWVYRDRGLPDLTIVNVAPSQLEARNGLPAGWLVAIEVRNDGDAIADVPVTVRSRTSTQTQRLRIPGRSSASIRIVFAGTPDEVVVNDGATPEAAAPTHTRQLALPAH
jgi:hypothetical protein